VMAEARGLAAQGADLGAPDSTAAIVPDFEGANCNDSPGEAGMTSS